jgi:hypothetical protein
MSGGLLVLLLLIAAWLTWFVRDRHIKGWKRPLFRSRTYNARATVPGEASKGYYPFNHHGGAGGPDGGGF